MCIAVGYGLGTLILNESKISNRMSERFIILTGGDGGFGNFGDEILLASWKDLYPAVQKAYSIVILMMNPPGVNTGSIISPTGGPPMKA